MAAPTNIRQINRRDVLAVLLKSQTSTRSELARATGLSQPTTGKIVDELMLEGVLRTATAPAFAATRIGRPGHDLALNGTTPYFLAVQLGVVHSRVAPLSIVPPATDQWTDVFKTPKSMKTWLASVTLAAKRILRPSVKAVVLSVPGLLDDETGLSILSPNLRWLEGHNVVTALQDELGLPVIAAQELRCLAMGHYAIDQSANSFLLVDFGNGVGSAPVLHGRLLQGQLPLAGELGHTPTPGNTLACGCGGVGCLETLVRRERLLKALGIDPEDWHDQWMQSMSQLRRNSLPASFQQALEAAALGIAGALNVLGLDRVIITGYLSNLPEHTMAILRDGIQAAAVAGRFRRVNTTIAPRRRQAGLARIGIDRFLAPA